MQDELVFLTGTTKEGRHLESSQHCCCPCYPCRAGIFHIKFLWHPEIPSCSFCFLKYFIRRRSSSSLCTTALWWERLRRESGLCVSSDDHHRGLFRWNMWASWKVSPFLLSKVGCVYLGMHDLWESGNLMLKSYIGNIPLKEEWSRSYSLYSLHLSVIWINWVLMLESGRFFPSIWLFLWF